MKNSEVTKEHSPKGKIGFTCSSFDLCHAGHMMMLKDCKNQCDYLIVGLQDDPSQGEDLDYRMKTGNKPKNTPVMSLAERKEIIEGIKYVDEIFVYSTETDLYNKIKNLKYDVRILGSDWEGKPYTGHDLPHVSYFHQRSHNYSTSELRKRVYEAEKERLMQIAEEEAATSPDNIMKKVSDSVQRIFNQKQTA